MGSQEVLEGAGILVQQRRAKLEEQGITGWKTFPIRLIDKKGVEIPGYEGFSITGRCGPRDCSKAKRVQKTNGFTDVMRAYDIGGRCCINRPFAKGLFMQQ